MSELERSEMHVQQGEVSFCRVFAKCGSGREDGTLGPEIKGDEDEDDDDM